MVMVAYRQAINNSTFENERGIGKAVAEWTVNYNKKHTGKVNINSLHKEICIFLYNC